MIIPMDLPSSHQEPRGPMTRARARALEKEVTSFLSDITYDPLETWLLPMSDMLCMIRCQEDPPKNAREDGRVAKFTDEENRRKEKKTAPGPGHPAPAPDIRPLETSTTAPSQPPNIYRPRTSGPSPEIRPEARTSGTTHQNLQKMTPPARTSGLRARTFGPSGRPEHPARRPDIRLRLSAHSKGPKPMHPFAPLDYIYSPISLFLGLALV